MKYNEYIKKRNEMLNEAEKLLNDGDLKGYEAKEQEIKELDEKYEAAAKAQANMNALKNQIPTEPIVNMIVDDGGKVATTVVNEKDEQKVYLNAWANYMQGKSIEGQEKDIFDKVNAEFSNAYTHDTNNTAILIPETVVAGIWKRAEEMYPFLADIRKFNVRGTLTMKKHTGITAGDAKFYSEGTVTEDEQNQFGEITLSGCELAKAITVSWKLRSMATEEFIPFIINELGERVGVALGTAVHQGAGPTASPREPEGVQTALLAESGTPQIVTYDPDNTTTPVSLKYEMLTNAISKIHSSYLSGVAIYANNATIWNELANLKDGNDRPLFIPDVTSGGVGRILGFVVKPDAGVEDGNILFGNAAAGYIMNTNEPMSIATEEHVKARTVDYAAYTIVDGAVLDTKAFALIRKVPAV